ncbi:hypothetical protein N752_13340 [Desulforamulus aquiferis]|nr:hypothetical protein [Desulforamulus aquiferis]RYD04352.1 hypothetical protein N752_13340 [Desulforamulus aquiferis]
MSDKESTAEKLKRIWDKLNNTRHDEIIPLIKANKKVFIISAISMVVVIGAAFLIKINYDLMGKANQPANNPITTTQNSPNPNTGQNPSYTYLPDTKRQIENRDDIRDPFAGTMLLKGVITGGGGKDMAIIQMGNISHIAEVGTELSPGLFLEEVKKDTVVLKSEIEIIQLDINGKTKTEIIQQEEDKNTGEQGGGSNDQNNH